MPGTQSLSLATVGCNFKCDNCQNWDISQGFKDKKEILGQKLLPKDIINLALKQGIPSISYTYTEPTIFLEYALDTMKLAKKKGIKNCWISNGFMSKESAKEIIPHLDAANIDLKSFSDGFYQKHCGAKLKPVLETAKLMKKSGVWLELTTLVIPTLSDSEKMFQQIAQFIKKELGNETPWHITRFSGAISWKLKQIPDTPIKTLKQGYDIGKETGLKYVYTGNVPGLPSEDTICPECGALGVDRTGYFVKRYDEKGKCPRCGADLNLISN
jgi:pyruvate formate lyase activating enzyme